MTEKLESFKLTGLTEVEAKQRLQKYGINALKEHKVNLFERLIPFFWGPIPWMIEIAAILSLVVKHWADLSIILTMLFVNAMVGFWQEYKADNAIQMLKQRLALKARVLRDNKWQEINASLLVPGDTINIKLGCIIPADAKLINGSYLSVDESTLTGESFPVDKNVNDTVYSGSIVKMGEMVAEVTATGMQTYFGKTAALVEEASNISHFQRAVLRIGNFLISVTIGLVILTGIVALLRNDPWLEALRFMLILTVASIPVALPAVLSVTMAIGAERLAKMKAIVAKLVAIEEMAGMDILCSDKTGTLTKNILTLGEPYLMPNITKDQLYVCAVLASQPMELDAIDYAILSAFNEHDMLQNYKILDFRPFNPVSKHTLATVEANNQKFSIAKGAPQVIFALCKMSGAQHQTIKDVVNTNADKGYRTLGVARTDSNGNWQLLGLLQLFDPPREDSASTIAAAKKMGLNIKMVTGDHEAIAKQTARKLGLGTDILVASDIFDQDGHPNKISSIIAADGFARVLPTHKFEIVKALQTNNHIVGMTGDGVNDAPALKEANVGIAVSGATDAARAAADLVLTAPGLSVITMAIEEARRIFERMTSYAIYRIAETTRVLLFMTTSILFLNFYPVNAIMIVLLALLNDIPIMMIAYDNAPMAQMPVKWDMLRVLTVASVLGIFGVFASFGLFWYIKNILSLETPVVQSIIFLKLLVAGHMTIYLTRNRGAIWQKPWPNLKLVIPCEATQFIGTLAVVYGWFTPAIGWTYALFVWGYAFITFAMASLLKILTYYLLDYATVCRKQQ